MKRNQWVEAYSPKREVRERVGRMVTKLANAVIRSGFTPKVWREPDGTWHVQPGVTVGGRMVTRHEWRITPEGLRVRYFDRDDDGSWEMVRLFRGADLKAEMARWTRTRTVVAA